MADKTPKVNTVATFAADSSAKDMAALVANGLSANDHRCGRVTKVDGMATFTVKRRGLSSLIMVYAYAGKPGRWILTVGSGVTASGALIGINDDHQRKHVGDSIDAILLANDQTNGVRWFTTDAWALISPKPEKSERRRWWSRVTR